MASALEGEEGFRVVGKAGSLAEARRMLHEEEHQPVDVAVIDLGLPDGYGGDLIPDRREANPRAQALVLSASLDRVEIARAVLRGSSIRRLTSMRWCSPSGASGGERRSFP